MGGEILDVTAIGHDDLEDGVPLEARSIFRLASATKIFVSVAFMTLVEEGLVSLDDPVSQHLPGFRPTHVFDAAGSPVPGAGTMTILDLLRHTGGLGYGYTESYRAALVAAHLMETGVHFGETWEHPWSLEEWALRLAEVPLEAQPGTSFSYGLTHDLLGAVIQSVSGQRLDDFVRDRVLLPLGLEDTGFAVAPEDLARLTSFYNLEEGRLVRVERGEESPFREPPFAPSGGGGWDQVGNGGMVSSAPDFARLLLMLRNGGEMDGVRILRRETVDTMLRNHLAGIGTGDSYWEGVGFGMGFAYVYDDTRFSGLGSNGKIWWAGSTNVLFWMDPGEDIIGVFMTHTLPFGHRGVMDLAEQMTYDAIR
jgi:CubicO group peptidase (beta-lactamase class C family)